MNVASCKIFSSKKRNGHHDQSAKIKRSEDVYFVKHPSSESVINNITKVVDRKLG